MVNLGARILLVVALFSMILTIFFLPLSSAETAGTVQVINTNYYQDGYCGNSTIYMVYCDTNNRFFKNVTLPPSNDIYECSDVLPQMHEFNNFSTLGNFRDGQNWTVHINSVLTDSFLNTSSGDGIVGSFSQGQDAYLISIPIVFTERYSYYEADAYNLVPPYSNYPGFVNLTLSQEQAKGVKSYIDLACNNTMGLNASGNYLDHINNVTKIYNIIFSSVSDILKLACPSYAVVSTGYNLYKNIVPTGTKKGSQICILGNGTAFLDPCIKGGNSSSELIGKNESWIWNDTFSYGTIAMATITSSEMGHDINFQIGGCEGGLPFGYNQVLYNFSAVPANQIAGQVLLNNNLNTPDANQWVSICHVLGERSTASGETLCTETYHVKTNSYGEYRFFASCNTGYGVSANLSTPFGDSCHTSSITTGGAGGTTYDNFSLYTSIVSGKVTDSSNGKPISGADVTFTSSGGTSYTVSTNDTGGYSIDIANNGTYSIKVTASGYLGSSGSVSLSDNTDTQNFPLTPAGTVNFDESGLHGNTWSVTLDGQSEQSTSSQISFEVAYGSYSYSIGSVSGYSSSPSSGTVISGSSPVTQDISFSATSYYGVTFDESGLPSGHTWSVTMGGTTNSASTGSSIGFSEPNGYFSYSPSRLLVAVPGEPGYYYDYSASGGTAHVNGAAQTIDISYSHIIVHYCVNASAEILLANNTYDRAANITDGMFVMTYNITTGTLQKGEVTSVLSVNESSLYTINGNLVVSGDQPILTSNGWVNASSLHKGELVFDPITGSFVDIYSLHHSQETETMYDFIISGNDNYIAYTYLLQGV
jgi:hypothetical protein